MGNLTTSFRKFLQNKNTVTVVGVILAIFVLYFAYNMRIKNAINPQMVPYAKEQIKAGTQITESVIGYMEVPPAMIAGDVLLNKKDILNQYAAYDTVIPKGSLFYKRAVVSKEQLPGNIIMDIKPGYELYNLSVNTYTTYGNEIVPGNYIDIWLKAVNKVDQNQQLTDDANKVMYGKLIQNVEVLAVKDANGVSVFQNTDENRAPAMISFALPTEYFILLKKASFMRTYETSIEISPTNESLSDEPGNVQLSSEQLKEWINQHTYWTDN